MAVKHASDDGRDLDLDRTLSDEAADKLLNDRAQITNPQGWSRMLTTSHADSMA